VAGHILLWRMLAKARPAPLSMNILLAELAGKSRPRLLISDKIHVPISCGLLRPTIVLPAELSDFNRPELVWVLRHELAHLKRHDGWACQLFGLGQAVYFYLPWFWSLWRQVRLCQEYIADAAAVEQSPEVTEYAEYLLGLSQKVTAPVAATGV